MRNPFKRETLNDLEFYDDEFEYNEPQIIESYSEEEFKENETNKKNYKRYKRYKKIINIVFSIILLLLVLVTIDVICVSKYEIGPFFAIKTATLKDGGTKVYHGLGYKVIKYNEIQGRRDTEIGSWVLKYDVNPIKTSDLDLAIEYLTDSASTYKYYYKKYVKVTSTVKSIDKEKNQLVLEYLDEDTKYTLDIICTMAEKESLIDALNEGDSVSVVGNIMKFESKNKKNPNKVYINDCFVELNTAAEIVEIED